MTPLAHLLTEISNKDPNVGMIFGCLIDVLEEQLSIPKERVWENLAMAFGSYTVMIRGGSMNYDESSLLAHAMLTEQINLAQDSQRKNSPMG